MAEKSPTRDRCRAVVEACTRAQQKIVGEAIGRDCPGFGKAGRCGLPRHGGLTSSDWSSTSSTVGDAFVRIVRSDACQDANPTRLMGLLRICHKWPSQRAAHCYDESAPFH